MPFTATDICDIISTCASSGVHEIIIGDIHLDFYVKPGEHFVEAPPSAEYNISAVQEEIERQELEEENKDYEEDALSESILSDPTAYRQMKEQINNLR